MSTKKKAKHSLLHNKERKVSRQRLTKKTKKAWGEHPQFTKASLDQFEEKEGQKDDENG